MTGLKTIVRTYELLGTASLHSFFLADDLGFWHGIRLILSCWCRSHQRTPPECLAGSPAKIVAGNFIVGNGAGRRLRIHDGFEPVVEATGEHIVVFVTKLSHKHPCLVGFGTAVGIQHIGELILVQHIRKLRRQDVVDGNVDGTRKVVFFIFTLRPDIDQAECRILGNDHFGHHIRFEVLCAALEFVQNQSGR